MKNKGNSVGSRPRVPLIPLYHGIRVFSDKLGGIRVLWYKGFSAARSAANFLETDIKLIKRNQK